MKITGHIPIEQYGFIEIESDNRDEVIEEYHAIKALFEDKEGLPLKEWSEALDRYLTTNTMKAEVYESMSREQMVIVQEIKRSIKRIDYKNNK